MPDILLVSYNTENITLSNLPNDKTKIVRSLFFYFFKADYNWFEFRVFLLLEWLA